MLAILPVLPNNDSVSYVECGRVSNAKRPIDHYAPPDHIPTVAEIPNVEAWRQHAHPSYGYPWLYLDLPPDWATDARWVTERTKPPLAQGRWIPTNRGWDNAFAPGASWYFDGLLLTFPVATRALAAVVLNHGFVLCTALLIWRTGCTLGWPATGWAAGLIYGLASSPGARAQELMTEPLFIVLDVGSIALVVAGVRRARRVPLAAGGVLLGLAIAVRAAALLQPLAVVAVLAGMARSRRDWLGRTAAFAVPCALVVVATLTHNRLAYGRFAYSTSFGRHLFNRVVTVDRQLDPSDASTQLILSLAARPRSGGDQAHPYQTRSLDVFQDGSCWPLYWMLRWQGLDVEAADGALRRAALAAIRRDPTGYLLRSARGMWALAGSEPSMFIVRVTDPDAYRQFITAWFVPQFRLAPYNWVAAQWRVFKEEMPLYGPPALLAPTLRARLLWWWAHLPDIGRPIAFLALGGCVLGMRRWCRDGWGVVAGSYLALLVVPALLQTPNARYAEPARPFGMLLACYAITWSAGRARLIWRRKPAWSRSTSPERPAPPGAPPRAGRHSRALSSKPRRCRWPACSRRDGYTTARLRW